MTVINGLIDSVEDTVFNINTNNSHAVSGVAVDESSNILYVCDNANQFAANGSINVFDANNNYAFNILFMLSFFASLAVIMVRYG